MKRVLFLTNYASPYRVRFFDQLGKTADVTVLYSDRVENIRHRDGAWFEEGQGGFHPVQLKAVARLGDENLCPDVVKWLKKPYDACIICGYSSPTAMLAMACLRLRRIPFYMEVDGGLIREEGKGKFLVKKKLVTMADRWLSTGRYTTDFLAHYGANRERIETYPFSSLFEKDILTDMVSPGEKERLRQELGIPQRRIILAVGQCIPRKGFDLLLKAAKDLPEDTAVCIVGGEPVEEYLALQKELGLDRVYFPGFQKKESLQRYYRCADLFVLPTREDIWGLVINEAMAYGLPVITTDRCVAGLELVEDGVNGYIVPVEDVEALKNAMLRSLQGDLEGMGAASLEKIRPYTIENMAKAHMEILERG